MALNSYPTKLAEGFAKDVVKQYFESSVAEKITNSDYEGQITGKQSKVNIMTFGALALQTYAGSALTADDLTESVGTLTTDQWKAWYFKIQDIDTFRSWIKNPESTITGQVANTLKETIDAHVLSSYKDVHADNNVGTDYTTGTVTVTVTTGAVVGSGTTFTAAMVGKSFKATGHTTKYRITSYTSATAITIADEDNDADVYTGGAIAGGTAYTIYGGTAITLTSSNIYGYLVDLATKLDEKKIPTSDRWLVINSAVKALLRKDSTNFSPAVESARNEVVKRGLVGEVAGFTVYSSQQVAGDNTTGYQILAGHKSAITMAMGFTETGIEDLIGDFGKAYKGLAVYGKKVVAERHKALAVLLGKI